MRYIEQTTPYLCGQACVAMLADVTIEEVVDIMKTNLGTSKKQISDALKHYGIEHASKLTKADNNSVLPDVCILKCYCPNMDTGFYIIKENTMIQNLDYWRNVIQRNG